MGLIAVCVKLVASNTEKQVDRSLSLPPLAFSGDMVSSLCRSQLQGATGHIWLASESLKHPQLGLQFLPDPLAVAF